MDAAQEGGTVIGTLDIERNTVGTNGSHDAADVADAIVESLARALELHDSYRGRFGETASHTLAIAKLTLELAQKVAPELAINPQLRHGSRLHDIGMIGVAPATLLKQGTLTRHEYEEIREHTWLGERIVAPVPLLNGVARQIIGSHTRSGMDPVTHAACAARRFRWQGVSSRWPTPLTR